MSQKNVIVAFGGVSPEHEVSVLTAIQVLEALKETEYQLIPLYVTKSGRWLTGEKLMELENYKDLDKLRQQSVACTFSHNDLGKPVLLETEKRGFFQPQKGHLIHAVIPAFHGSEGENGAFQGTCEMYNIPFAGSGVLASSLGMDKIKAKELCRAHDFPVVPGIDFVERTWEDQQDQIIREAEEIGYPLIVKPVTLGSSIGVSKANSTSQLITAVESTFRYDDNVMIEQAVAPLMEVNCAVMGIPSDMEASVCEQPLGQEEMLSFKDKYQSDGSAQKGMASADRIIPADISDELTEHIQQLAKDIFATFRASGIARLDFLINSDTGDVYFNEINTIPGSFSFYLWEENGLSMRELMFRLIEIAVEQHRHKTGRVRSYETNLLDEKAVQGIKGLKGPGDNDK